MNNIEMYIPLEDDIKPTIFSLIVGYEENGRILFYKRIIEKVPDIARDTKLLGRSFYCIDNIEIIKHKIRNYSFYTEATCLRETLDMDHFKDEYAVYLCFCDDCEWYAYDPDWKRWISLKKYYNDEIKLQAMGLL